MSVEPMLSVEEAQALVLETVRPRPVERVPLAAALGRVLAEDVRAGADSPPFDCSAMDGYAVRFDDVAAAAPDRPVSLEVIEDIPAGAVGRRPVRPGQASRIMTGAPIPEGADTVIRVEDTRAAGQRVEIRQAGERGASIRHRGSNMRAGSVVLRAGTPSGPGEIGVLASVQRAFAPVHGRPTVTILSTGDELVEVDEPLGPGRIVNSNSLALAAAVEAAGGLPVVLPIARDTEADIRRRIEAALQGDFVISSGGVSVGDYDFVKQVLEDMGAQEVLWRVAMKPGKPLYFCRVAGRPCFGLPGNPVSSLVSFLQFVRPAIRKASGHPPASWLLPVLRARLEHEVYNDNPTRRHYMRALLRLDGDGRLTVQSGGRDQDSHVLTSMLGANAFIVVEASQRLESGQDATVQLFGPLA